MNANTFLQGKGVSRLCHFTKLRDLTHILSSDNGIVASNSIRPDIRDQKDAARYDGELAHVCCSVEYPNSWYLGKAIERDRDPIFRDWVVIYIDIDILNHRTAKFCACNAAKDHGGYIFKDVGQLGILYASPTVLGWRRDTGMLSCCPTNGQAEILVKDNIPYSFFSGIAVSSDKDGKSVYAMIKTYDKREISIYLAPDVLSTRWSNLVRKGIRPQELELSFGKEK